MKILAFGHQKRVGKDTACRFAATQLRLMFGLNNIQKKGFADKVKSQCYELFAWGGLQPAHYYDEPSNLAKREEILPLLGMTPRQLWIGHGMACRTYYPDAWIHALLKGTAAEFLLISDLRFPNEAKAIQELGGWVVKIVRPSVPHTSDAADDPLLDFNGWNTQIVNEGSLNDFMIKITAFLEKIMTDPSAFKF